MRPGGDQGDQDEIRVRLHLQGIERKDAVAEVAHAPCVSPCHAPHAPCPPRPNGTFLRVQEEDRVASHDASDQKEERDERVQQFLQPVRHRLRGTHRRWHVRRIRAWLGSLCKCAGPGTARPRRTTLGQATMSQAKEYLVRDHDDFDHILVRIVALEIGNEFLHPCLGRSTQPPICLRAVVDNQKGNRKRQSLRRGMECRKQRERKRETSRLLVGIGHWVVH